MHNKSDPNHKYHVQKAGTCTVKKDLLNVLADHEENLTKTTYILDTVKRAEQLNLASRGLCAIASAISVGLL